MSHIKTFELFNESVTDDEKVKLAYKDMLLNFNSDLFGLSGLRLKISFMLKNEKDTDRLNKLKECLEYLVKIQPSLKDGDFTLHFKQFYSNVDSYVKTIYQTLKYVMPIIKFFNIQGMENVDKDYKNYVNLANTSLGWQNRLPKFLLK